MPIPELRKKLLLNDLLKIPLYVIDKLDDFFKGGNYDVLSGLSYSDLLRRLSEILGAVRNIKELLLF